MKHHKLLSSDDSQRAYENYYALQSGSGVSFPYYHGRRYQKGHGIGNILGGLIRRFVMPFMKSQGKKLAQTAIQTGMQVAGDVVGGRSFKQSVGEHVPKAIKRTAGDLLRQSLVGNVGSKTVVKRPSGVRAKRAKKKKRPGDIFS